MPQKIFKTYRQQISILRSRGMNIKTGSAGSRAMRILERENYYNVVNGYKDLFIKSPATATSDEVYAPTRVMLMQLQLFLAKLLARVI